MNSAQSGHGPFAPAQDIEAILALHRAGNIAEAGQAYQHLARLYPADGNIIGLLAMVAFQSGNIAQAKLLWRQALAMESPVAARIRDLNNLLATLIEEGAHKEAAALVPDTLPPWPAERRPDARERTSLLSLAASLTRLKHAEIARALLESAAAHFSDDDEALLLLGQLRLRLGDAAGAREVLARVKRAADPGLTGARLECAIELGLRVEAETLKADLLRLWPIYSGPRGQNQAGTVLILNHSSMMPGHASPLDIYNVGNYPSQIMSRLADEFHMAAVFADTETGRVAARALGKPMVILNNIVNGEIISMEGPRFLTGLTAFAESFGTRIINAPAEAALTTRQRMAARLEGIPGLVIPKISRIRAHRPRFDELVEHIEQNFGYPVILRTTHEQIGNGVARIDSRTELVTELETREGQELYVIRFYESRPAFGMYRKIRIAVVGDAIIPIRVDFSPLWMVHGRIWTHRQQFYRDNRHLLAEEQRIVANFESIFGAEAMNRLRKMRRRIPLDIFGIDCDIMADGRMIFFEANASMFLLTHLGPECADLVHPIQAEELLLDHIRARLRG